MKDPLCPEAVEAISHFTYPGWVPTLDISMYNSFRFLPRNFHPRWYGAGYFGGGLVVWVFLMLLFLDFLPRTVSDKYAESVCGVTMIVASSDFNSSGLVYTTHPDFVGPLGEPQLLLISMVFDDHVPTEDTEHFKIKAIIDSLGTAAPCWLRNYGGDSNDEVMKRYLAGERVIVFTEPESDLYQATMTLFWVTYLAHALAFTAGAFAFSTSLLHTSDYKHPTNVGEEGERRADIARGRPKVFSHMACGGKSYLFNTVSTLRELRPQLVEGMQENESLRNWIRAQDMEDLTEFLNKQMKRSIGTNVLWAGFWFLNNIFLPFSIPISHFQLEASKTLEAYLIGRRATQLLWERGIRGVVVLPHTTGKGELASKCEDLNLSWMVWVPEHLVKDIPAPTVKTLPEI